MVKTEIRLLLGIPISRIFSRKFTLFHLGPCLLLFAGLVFLSARTEEMVEAAENDLREFESGNGAALKNKAGQPQGQP